MSPEHLNTIKSLAQHEAERAREILNSKHDNYYGLEGAERVLKMADYVLELVTTLEAMQLAPAEIMPSDILQNIKKSADFIEKRASMRLVGHEDDESYAGTLYLKTMSQYTKDLVTVVENLQDLLPKQNTVNT